MKVNSINSLHLYPFPNQFTNFLYLMVKKKKKKSKMERVPTEVWLLFLDSHCSTICIIVTFLTKIVLSFHFKKLKCVHKVSSH